MRTLVIKKGYGSMKQHYENNRVAAGVQNKNGGGGRGGSTVVVVQRQHLPSAETVVEPEAVIEAVNKGPKLPPPIDPKLLQELKHSAAGVEALGTLVQYLVFDLDAFSTPQLKKTVENLKCRYEEELKRRDKLSSRNTEALLEDVKLYAERAERAEKDKEELLAREDDLKRMNAQLQKEIGEMQEKFRQELTEVSRTGEGGKLRDEIVSLQAVLELRTKEMHEYRKKAEEWCQKSEALNSAVARAAALQARVEDLEAQLLRKASCERKLQEKVRHLSESVERECRQNEQLALENEVLEWKVNESAKLMSTLTSQPDVSCMLLFFFPSFIDL
ncbi:hypothetical protein J437_LFUL000805 [Ladona fulva]|uniref:Uncharacterized protein n=1 Tax=Ladona fulva TaxID=123851 RepID=A0A8K0KV99_LADFU|nr:hypothetical protein J437_LFUL000805 [Ladona fulva]